MPADPQALKAFLQSYKPNQFTLEASQLSYRKRRHLRKFMFEHGTKNGKLLFLPYDHGLEHGPSDFFINPGGLDPESILELAVAGDFSGVVLQIGIAEKFWQKTKYKEAIPLVLKLNGKTNIPPDDYPLSPLNASIEDAVSLGADAVGYTLYVGSYRQEEDVKQFFQVRKDAQEAGLPLIVWAYPRGRFVKETGEINSLAMVAYAARVAAELGADMVKVNMPKHPAAGYHPQGKYAFYNNLQLTDDEMIKWTLLSAASTPLLLSGGAMEIDERLIAKAEIAVKAGVTGIIFGRNLFQRNFDEAIALTNKLKQLLLL